MDSQKINIPLSKAYFTTFLNNFISIIYLNDKSTNLESLKNLLFPPEYLDNGNIYLFTILQKILQISAIQ